MDKSIQFKTLYPEYQNNPQSFFSFWGCAGLMLTSFMGAVFHSVEGKYGLKKKKADFFGVLCTNVKEQIFERKM